MGVQADEAHGVFNRRADFQIAYRKAGGVASARDGAHQPAAKKIENDDAAVAVFGYEEAIFGINANSARVGNGRSRTGSEPELSIVNGFSGSDK